MKLFKYLLFYFLAVTISGCATVKEGVKCVAGVSTKCLESARKDAIKKTFNLDYAACDTKVREILKNSGAYIYAEDKAQSLIAIYISAADTTPVGVFFDKIDAATTEIEISGPSTDANEIIAKRVFSAIEGKDKGKEEAKGTENAENPLGNK